MILRRRRIVLFTAFLLYGLALFFRLPGIGSDAPQPDEQHWLVRTHKCIRRWQTGDYRRYNAHLGHPGATPVFIMLGANAFWKAYNQAFGYGPGDPRALDELTTFRRANAIFSSLTVPVLFLGVVGVVGLRIATVGAALLAANPRHVAVSRLAHLDGVLTLLITCAIVLFSLGERRRRPSLTLFAGVFWGLAIATKPTAGFLIVGLLFYRAVRYVLQRRVGEREFPVRWSDIWAIVIGHVVFAAIYTRLWESRSRYVTVFAIDNSFTRALEELGRLAEAHPGGVVVLLLIATVGGVALWRSLRRGCSTPAWVYHVEMLWVLTGLIVAVLVIDRDIPQNIIRYWIWAAGLSKREHTAYGIVWEPPPLGYLSLFLTRLPPLVLLGVVVAVLVLLYRVFHGAKRGSQESTFLYLLFLLSAVSWSALLNVSSKQAFRYVMPVVPGISILAAFGLLTVARPVVAWTQARALRSLAVPRHELFSAFAVGVIAAQVFMTLTWNRHYALYRNSLYGDLREEIANAHATPVFGSIEVLEFLRSAAKERGRRLVVAVLGDIAVLEFTASRLWHDEPRGFDFIPFRNFESADYLLVFPGFQARAPVVVGERFAELSLAYAYVIRGIPVMTLYAIPISDYRAPVKFSIQRAPRHVGRTSALIPTTRSVISVEPGRDVRGFIFFGIFARVGPGSYRVTIPVGDSLTGSSTFEVQDDEPVLEVEFGECKRLVKLGEIRRAFFEPIQFQCTVTGNDVYAQLRAFWPGTRGLKVGSPMVERIDRGAPG